MLLPEQTIDLLLSILIGKGCCIHLQFCNTLR